MASTLRARWIGVGRIAALVLLLGAGSAVLARPGPGEDGRARGWHEGAWTQGWLYGVQARRAGPRANEHGHDARGEDDRGRHAGPPPTRDDDRVPHNRRCMAEPDAHGLRIAFKQTFQNWLRRQRRHYGETYYRLHYTLDVTDLSVSGTNGLVQVAYDGNVRERATGITVSASGSASASFVWIHCRWKNTSIDY